jgi:hypothetical protein
VCPRHPPVPSPPPTTDGPVTVPNDCHRLVTPRSWSGGTVCEREPTGGWTVWYTRHQDGTDIAVGVLTSEVDADSDHGCELVAAEAPVPALG